MWVCVGAPLRGVGGVGSDHGHNGCRDSRDRWGRIVPMVTRPLSLQRGRFIFGPQSGHVLPVPLPTVTHRGKLQRHPSRGIPIVSNCRQIVEIEFEIFEESVVANKSELQIEFDFIPVRRGSKSPNFLHKPPLHSRVGRRSTGAEMIGIVAST